MTEQVLIDEAHRVDGYAWAAHQIKGSTDVTTFFKNELYDPLVQTWRLPHDPLAALALNFWLHRNFRHWGALPSAGSPEWLQMVLLYLHTYRLATPSAFRHDQASAWEGRKKGSAEAVAAELRGLLARRLGCS